MDDVEKIKKVVNDFGLFLEVANPGLMRVFGTQIPASVLPHDKELIERGLDSFIRIFRKKGDEQSMRYCEGCKISLMMYIDDRDAIKALAQRG
jgi:hypothetical protein